MNISKIIESVRKQPEYIRIRYVWGSVFVAMFVILIVWFFSFSLLIKTKIPLETSGETLTIEKQIENVKPSSIEEYVDEPLDTGAEETTKQQDMGSGTKNPSAESEGVINQKDTSEPKVPTVNGDLGTAPSTTRSDTYPNSLNIGSQE